MLYHAAGVHASAVSRRVGRFPGHEPTNRQGQLLAKHASAPRLLAALQDNRRKAPLQRPSPRNQLLTLGPHLPDLARIAGQRRVRGPRRKAQVPYGHAAGGRAAGSHVRARGVHRHAVDLPLRVLWI